MGDKVVLESLINPEGCSEGDLQANMQNLSWIMNLLDQVFEFEYNDDRSEITINIRNVNKIDATTTNVYHYNDGSETKLCTDYCPTAIASRLAGSGAFEPFQFDDKEKRFRQRQEELAAKMQVWQSYQFDGPQPANTPGL